MGLFCFYFRFRNVHKNTHNAGRIELEKNSTVIIIRVKS